MKQSKVILTLVSVMVIVSMLGACAPQATPMPEVPAVEVEQPAAVVETEAPAEPAAAEQPAEVTTPPAITMADLQGIAPGMYPQQYEVAEFEAATGGVMEFSDRGEIDAKILAFYPDIPDGCNRTPARRTTG